MYKAVNIGPLCFGFKCTYAPHKVYGISSAISEDSHSLFIDYDDFPLERIIENIDATKNSPFLKDVVLPPCFVIVKSCDTKKNYHLISPFVNDKFTTMLHYLLLNHPMNSYNHMAMGMLRDKWILRITPKEQDDIHPYVIGVLPLRDTTFMDLLHMPFLNFLLKMNYKYNYPLMKKYGLMHLEDYFTRSKLSECTLIDKPVEFEKYNTVSRNDKS